MTKNRQYKAYIWDEVPLFVDLQYIADLLKCSTRLLRMEIKSGKLKACKVGKMYRVNKDDLIAYTQKVG